MDVSLFHKTFGLFREQFLSTYVLSLLIQRKWRSWIEHVYFQKSEQNFFNFFLPKLCITGVTNDLLQLFPPINQVTKETSITAMTEMMELWK